MYYLCPLLVFRVFISVNSASCPYGLSKYSDLFLFTFTQFFSSMQVTLWADVPGLGPSAPVRYLLGIRGI